MGEQILSSPMTADKNVEAMFEYAREKWPITPPQPFPCPSDEEVLDWQEQERADKELGNYYRRVMRPQERKAIAEMKEVAGAWGLERRLEYLITAQTEIELTLIEWEAEYQMRAEADEPFIERAFLKQRLDGKKEFLAKVQREVKAVIQALRAADMGLKPSEQGLTDSEIERARQYPIEQLVEVGRNGRASCVNPAHEDRNPSMGIKGNRVFCFSCGFRGDAIDVFRALRGVDFVAAVKALQ